MAIKVGGTNVITDARALNNITSADATTVAALGSAGVGGKTTLIADSSISSGTSAVTVNFTGGYKYYRILLMDIAHNANNNYGLVCRLTNSSGSVISSTNSYNSSYRTLSGGGAGQSFDADKIYMFPSPSAVNDKCTVMAEVFDPYSTSFATVVHGHSHIATTHTDGEHNGYFAGSRIASAERNNGLRIFFHDYYGSGTNTFTGGRITTWGVSV